MRVRDILDAPQLRMGLLHGDAAALDRAVARVCVTDMPDPRPFVTAGALVCTGLVWRQSAEDSDRYVGMLARAGVAGVVAGQALHGFVPEDVVAACARHDLPLLSAPQSAPFSRIIEYLADQAAENRWQQVQTGLMRQRRLLSAVAEGADIGDLLSEVAAECGFTAWLLTATGVMVAGTEPLAEEEIDRILATALTAPRLPAVAAGGITVLSVSDRLGSRMTAWYLVIRAETAGDQQDAESAAADLAAVAELYRVRHTERLRFGWDLADRSPELVAEISAEPAVAVVCEVLDAAGSTDGACSTAGAWLSEGARLSQCALPVQASRGGEADRGHGAPGVAVETGPAARLGRMRTAVHDTLPHPGGTRLSHGVRYAPAIGLDVVRAALHDLLPAIVTGIDREGRLTGSFPGVETEVAERLRRGFARVRPLLGSTGIGVGVSARRDGENLAGAFAAAAAVAPAIPGEARVRIADIDSAAGLFTAIPDQLQRRFAERVLGPVVDYDRRTGAGLVHTLEVFLGCEGSWRQAAERMHLHLNTVRYRIGRVEELTGRDLGRLDDRLDLYLAVRTLAGYTAPV